MNKYPIQKSEAEWKEILGEERYRILRGKGTERPFSGSYNLHFEEGIYACGACHTRCLKVIANLKADVVGPLLMKQWKGLLNM